MRAIKFVTLLTALVLALAVSAPASAKPGTTSPEPTPRQMELQRQIVDTKNSISAGESAVAATVNGHDLIVRKSANGEPTIVADTGTATTPGGEAGEGTTTMAAYGVCTNVVAAGVFALGAAAVGAAAAMGGIVVAGVFLAPNVLGLLAGAMGSYAAVQTIISAYVC